MNGWTNYQATFSNQPNDSKLVIYTKLVNVLFVVITMDPPEGWSNKINFTKENMTKFVQAVYQKFSSDNVKSM